MHAECPRQSCLAVSVTCRGSGYGRGEGFAALVLRRSQTGSESYLTIKGSAVNQDGRSGGLTAPNGPSQTTLVR